MKEVSSNLNEKFISACINNNLNDILFYLAEGADPFYNNGQALSIFCIEKPNLDIVEKLAKKMSFSEIKEWYKKNQFTISLIQEESDNLEEELELTNSLGKKYIKDLQQDLLYINPVDHIPLNERFLDACINNEPENAIDYLAKGADPFYNNGQALYFFCIKNPNLKLVNNLIRKTRIDLIKLKTWYEQNIATIKLIEQACIDGKNSIEITDSYGEKYTKELAKDSILYVKPFNQGNFASHYDNNRKILNSNGNCSGISTLYAIQNKKNNEKPNNLIEKLLEEKNLNIENSRKLYTISFFQKLLQTEEKPLLKANFANKEEALQQLDELVLKNTNLASFSFNYKSGGGHRMVIKTVYDNNYFLFEPNYGEIRICGLDALKNEILRRLEVYHAPQKSKIIEIITFCDYKEMLKPFEFESGLNIANKILAKHYLRSFLEETTKDFLCSIKKLEMAQPLKKYLEKKILPIVEKYSQDISSENLQLLASWSIFNNSPKLLELICKTTNFDINFQNTQDKSMIEQILEIRENLSDIDSLLFKKCDYDLLLKILINHGASHSNISNIDLTEFIDDSSNYNKEITNLSGENSHDN